MDVKLTEPVEIALRTLDSEERRRVQAWFGHLKNWETDKFVREHSHRLEEAGNEYVLHTSTDYRIFFKLEEHQIKVLDIATKATILAFGEKNGRGGS